MKPKYLYIFLIMIAAIVSACQTNDPATSTVPQSASSTSPDPIGRPASNSELSATKHNRVIAPAKEADALRLLGRALTHSGTGCQSFTEMAPIMEKTKKLLSAKGIAGLSGMVKEAAKKCRGYMITLTVSANPAITAVEGILGEADGLEEGRISGTTMSGTTGAVEDVEVTWHKYGWLHFAVVEGKVVAVRGNSSEIVVAEQ